MSDMYETLTARPSFSEIDRDAGSSNAINSKFQRMDFALLIFLWGLVLACSIVNLGMSAAALFLMLTLVLALRRPSNGVLVLLLIFYTPAITVGIPNIFSVVAGLSLSATLMVNPGSFGKLLLRPTRVFIAAFAFVIYATLLTIFAENMGLALPYYKKYLEGVALLAIVAITVNTPDDLSKVLKWWALVASFAAIVKTVHIYLGNDTFLYRTMETVFLHDEFNLDHRIHIQHGGEIGRRFLLPGEEPNYTSTSLVFPLAIALAFQGSAQKLSKILWAGISCMTAIACVGTYSRSGFLAALLVLGLHVVRGSLLKALVPVSVLSAIFSMAVLFIPSLHKRIFGIGDAVNEGATGRFYLWNKAFEMWLDSPIFGHGMSTFYDRYHSAVHNTYLQVLAETGLVGLGLYLGVILAAIRLRASSGGTSHGSSEYTHLRRGAFAGLAGFCFMIATVTYQDVKLFWLALAVFSSTHLLVQFDCAPRHSDKDWLDAARTPAHNE